MPKTSQIEISKLSLDLNNYRTVKQKKESDAIKAMISIKPEKFYAIMESIILDGYLPTENIIVLKDGDKYIVKEGNRRVAALKLIHGIYKPSAFNVKSSTINSISTLNDDWKKQNSILPCAIFDKKEEALADKVVALTHGKGEKASRDEWTSVATARHNRDAKGVSEPALDLLEKYLKHGDNLNNLQRERWAGDYHLTVLHEAIRLLHPRLGYKNSSELAQKYPKIKQINEIEKLILNIGLDLLDYKIIRNPNVDFAVEYGALAIQTTIGPAPTNNSNTTSNNSTTTNSNPNSNISKASISATSASSTQASASPVAKPLPKAYAVNDPKNVIAILKKFNPKGDRAKVVTLRNEIRKLKINDNPISFCFILRSMFEISAKAYCKENAISLKTTPKANKAPQERSLAELLKEVNKHLTNNNTDRVKAKELHGATTEITKAEGILSVTSMNQLVHNEKFSVQPPDICTLFSNIFPLLEAMN